MRCEMGENHYLVYIAGMYTFLSYDESNAVRFRISVCSYGNVKLLEFRFFHFLLLYACSINKMGQMSGIFIEIMVCR